MASTPAPAPMPILAPVDSRVGGWLAGVVCVGSDVEEDVVSLVLVAVVVLEEAVDICGSRM